jgi:hypothetical protein
VRKGVKSPADCAYRGVCLARAFALLSVTLEAVEGMRTTITLFVPGTMEMFFAPTKDYEAEGVIDMEAHRKTASQSHRMNQFEHR